MKGRGLVVDGVTDVLRSTNDIFKADVIIFPINEEDITFCMFEPCEADTVLCVST